MKTTLPMNTAKRVTMKSIMILLACICVAQPALSETLKCTLKSEKAEMYVPADLTVEVMDAGASARIRNAIIIEAGKEFVMAKIETDNARRTTYSWQLQGLKQNHVHSQTFKDPDLVYSLTIQKADGSARLYVIDTSVYNVWNSGAGFCSVTK